MSLKKETMKVRSSYFYGKKIHAHATVRVFDGIERLFWLPKPPFLLYLLCNKSNPLLCIFLKNGRMQHFCPQEDLARETDKCTYIFCCENLVTR